jgi:hypothetical protein
MKNWKDDIDPDWTIRDIYVNRLKMSPITKDQLRELLEMGFVEVVDDQVKRGSPSERRTAQGPHGLPHGRGDEFHHGARLMREVRRQTGSGPGTSIFRICTPTASR